MAKTATTAFLLENTFNVSFHKGPDISSLKKLSTLSRKEPKASVIFQGFRLRSGRNPIMRNSPVGTKK